MHNVSSSNPYSSLDRLLVEGIFRWDLRTKIQTKSALLQN